MRCCASPTTSTASISVRSGADGGRSRAAEAFTALLTSLALRPLAKPLGFYGEIVVDACALSVARLLPFHLPIDGERS
jgi:hypothetical protein